MRTIGKLRENFRPLRPESENRTYDSKRDYHHPRGSYSEHTTLKDRPLYCMFHERDTDHRTRDCPIFLESRKKMTQKHNQPPNPSIAKEVNNTSHWHQASQSSLSHQTSYQHSNTHFEYQSNYHRYHSPYNYTPYTSQAYSTQPTITYHPPHYK
jgi:hypothetical protein